MATFNWPGFGITSISPSLDQPASVNVSSYTGIRAVAANPWHGKWSFKVTLATMQGDANFQAIRAFFTQLQGQVNNFHLPAVEAPQNANTGVTVATAAAQGATSLALTGITTALVAGNMATINGQLLSLTSVGTLSGSNQTISFQPALRAVAQAILSPPVNGALTQSSGGSLAATTCYVRTTWVTATGETLPSTETSLAVSANNVLNVAAPASPPANATGWNVYVSNATGTETKQNASSIGTTTAWVEPTSGLIAGSALPGANTTTASSVETAKPYALVALNGSSFSWDIGQWRRYGLSFEADEDVSGTDGASPSGDVWSATISGTGGLSTPTDVVAALAASGGAAMIGFIHSAVGAIKRTVQDKLRDFISVKDLGALQDGSTDDSAAVASAASAGVFIVGPGNLKTNTAPNSFALISLGASFSGSAALDAPYPAFGTGALRLINKGSQNCFIAVAHNNTPANTNAQPCAITAHTRVDNNGNIGFALFGRADLYGTSGVVTNEVNSFNWGGAPSSNLPPTRAVGTTQSQPIALTVAAGGTFNSAIGMQICREGSSPQSFLTGIYMNPDAIVNYGILIDASSGSTFIPALIKHGVGANTGVQIQGVGTPNPNFPSLTVVDGSSVTRFVVKQDGSTITTPVAVSGLPAAGTAGRRHFVTDATATTFASIVAGSGTNKVPVYDDGTNWRIG